MTELEAFGVALATATLSTFAWGYVLVRSISAYTHKAEHRPMWLAMPITGVLVSIGTFASAIGFGISSGVLDFQINFAVLSLIASMGRGALLMAGIIAAAYYHPR